MFCRIKNNDNLAQPNFYQVCQKNSHILSVLRVMCMVLLWWSWVVEFSVILNQLQVWMRFWGQNYIAYRELWVMLRSYLIVPGSFSLKGIQEKSNFWFAEKLEGLDTAAIHPPIHPSLPPSMCLLLLILFCNLESMTVQSRPAGMVHGLSPAQQRGWWSMSPSFQT